MRFFGAQCVCRLVMHSGELRDRVLAHKILWSVCTKDSNCSKLGEVMGDRRSFEAKASDSQWRQAYVVASLATKKELILLDCLKVGTPNILQNLVQIMQEENLRAKRFVTALVKRVIKQVST